MENQNEHLKSLINRLESLDIDWKENKHLFTVKHRRINHFPNNKKLRVVEYETACKHYEDKRRALLVEIESLKNNIKY